jgi:Peptidase S46.
MNSTSYNRQKYAGIIDSIANCYITHRRSILKNEYINEALWASELIKLCSKVQPMFAWSDTMQNLQEQKTKLLEEIKHSIQSFDLQTDYKITTALYDKYEAVFGKCDLLSRQYLDQIYHESCFTSFDKIKSLTENNSLIILKQTFQNDPAWLTYKYIDSIHQDNLKLLRQSLSKMNRFYTRYMQALKEYKIDDHLYPDANSTLRVSYGYVHGIKPKDGLQYHWQTTLDGVIHKHNPAVEEFNVPQKLIELHRNKDFGRYAIDINGKNTVPVCFLASPSPYRRQFGDSGVE